MELKLPTTAQIDDIKSRIARKIERPQPIRPTFELNAATNDMVVSDVTADGVCYGSSGNNILKSADYGKTTTNLGVIPGGTLTPLVAWVLKMDDGAILVATNNRDALVGEVWRSDENEANFAKVLTFGTSGSYPGSTFGYSKFNNIVLVNEYGADKTAPNNPKYTYMSIDFGKTFTQIHALATFTGIHLHDIQYDPYEDIIWMVSGDGTDNKRVWMSPDRGVSWQEIFPPAQYTNVSILPNCILFGTDTALIVGFYRLDRPETGLRTVTEFNIVQAYLQTTNHPQMPMGSKSYSDFKNGVVYAAFYETAPYYTIPSTIYATKDGYNYFIVWQSYQDTVVTTGGCGVLAIAGASDAGFLVAYVRMGIDGKQNHTLKLTLPEWV